MEIPIYIQILSLVGALLCLVAYVAHQLNWMDSRRACYNLLNVFGSGILAYIAFRPFQVGFWIMETIWGLTSLYGLYKAFYKSTDNK